MLDLRQSRPRSVQLRSRGMQAFSRVGYWPVRDGEQHATRGASVAMTEFTAWRFPVGSRSVLSSLSWRRFAAVAGPGLVVMLADTDAGSIITAAQSGAEWGYRLLLLQLVLMPILYIVQELTVRLGIVSGKGHAELIRDQFGRGWAWLSVGTLVLACMGALLSELSGLAGVGLLMGVPTPS